MQMMKLPAYTDGLDENVARQVLQTSLELSFKVRGDFQHGPALLLHWSGFLFVLLEEYILETNFSQTKLFDSFLPGGSTGQHLWCIPVIPAISDWKYTLNFYPKYLSF